MVHETPDPKVSILLVDDEESIRRILAISLTDDGYDVTTAADGREALELFRSRPPDIVITDIKMPGMSGIELLDKIKAEHPDTEVIMITGHGDMQTAIESLKKDAVDFITKPIHDDVLAIALKRARERITARNRMTAYTKNLEAQVAEKVARLEASRQRYQQLFDESPCYITVQDRNLRIINANQRFLSDFDAKIGMHCYTAYKHRTQPCPDCPVMATFQDGLSHQLEMQVTAKSGELCHLFISTAPMQDDDQPLTRVIEMSTNITELRLLQDRLASLGLHAGTVSHAIKGLLTQLDGGIYLLNTGTQKEDHQRMAEGLDIINESSSRVRRMILDVLYYAKERSPALEEVDVLKMVQDVATQIAPRLKKKSVQLECRFDADIPLTEMDPMSMRIALTNILENALDACLEDKDKAEKKITFGLSFKSDCAIFDIIDNGIGMEKGTIDNLFDLFFSSKGTRGTGLGLFVAHRIITQHGGTIHVTSEKGRGTHFRVVLPNL